MPDIPEPTSYALTKGFYIRAKQIAEACLKTMNMPLENVSNDLAEPTPHDVPGEWFSGPF